MDFKKSLLVFSITGLLGIIISLFLLSSKIDFCIDKVWANGSYQQNVQLLARCVNGESRGESYEGQVAVAAVILNRTKHPSFPKTIAGVIYQPGAFVAVNDGQINAAIDQSSTVYKACQAAVNGYDASEGAIYYYNPKTSTNKWIFNRQIIKTIGKHVFAK